MFNYYEDPIITFAKELKGSKVDYVLTTTRVKINSSVDTVETTKLSPKQAIDLLEQNKDGIANLNNAAGILTIKNRNDKNQYLTIEMSAVNIKSNNRMNELLANSSHPIYDSFNRKKR